MKKIIILNGIHGAGKTTIGKYASSTFSGYKFFGEVGKQVRENVDYNVMQSGTAFDIEVINREIQRDYIIKKCKLIPIIETWHIGNIAYVMERSKDLVELYKGFIQNQLAIFDPLAVFIEIDWDTFSYRFTEKIDPHELDTLISFYRDISKNLFDIYEIFNIPYITVTNTGKLDIQHIHSIFTKLKTYEGKKF